MASLKDRTQPILLHNPRCSKSRGAKALLEEKGVSFEERLYLEDPLGVEELRELGELLGKPVLKWTRVKEAAFADAGLSDASSSQQVLEAMSQNPILMERPILIAQGQAVVGRPPEDILQLVN